MVKILGDFGPFSRMGKSIGYLVEFGSSRFLVDCGAPLFQQIGGHGLKNINGIVITHCHDDHKRWFSDLALFNMYEPGMSGNVLLITSEDIKEELSRSSGSALDRSLSKDSKKVIDIAFEDYIRTAVISPFARYRIVSREEGPGKTGLFIADRGGNPVGPEQAKIVISPKTKRARMLFRDPVYGEWVEPEHFYPFSSEIFYEKDRNIFHDRGGITIEAVKSPVWHGITAIGVKMKTEKDTLIFSSDTVHDEALWRRLCHEKRPQVLNMPREEFEAASIICGDINNYVERAWSEERYRDALDAFRDAVVMHDVSYPNSIVHTDYNKLEESALDKGKVLLTHSPDRMTSEWVLCNTGKTFLIRGNSFFEIVGNELFPLNADIYHKENGRYFVGYKNERGGYAVYEKDGYLGIDSGEDVNGRRPLFRVDLYEDVAGQYFPVLMDGNSLYVERKDGRIEVVRFSDQGSRGEIVVNCRNRLTRMVKP